MLPCRQLLAHQGIEHPWLCVMIALLPRVINVGFEVVNGLLIGGTFLSIGAGVGEHAHMFQSGENKMDDSGI